MNQIIDNKNKYHFQSTPLKIEISDEITEIPLENHIINKEEYKQIKLYKNNIITNFKKYLLKNRYRLQFFISLFIAVIFIIILFFNIYNANKQEKISKELLNNYSLTTLYQENNINNDNNINKKTSIVYENPFVIGMIRIPTINLNYPILSESNSDLLKISLCRFAGPMPNEIGNLCIAGHNYVDNRFFSRLHELENDDIIEIYDLNGKHIDYVVFSKFEVEENDLSCTNQNVGENRIITLLTCNNVNGKRTIIKAKESVLK